MCVHLICSIIVYTNRYIVSCW